jgi:hypothetical protein
MKYCFSIILCLNFYAAFAQKAVVHNIDSVYYLIDTANSSVKDRMWDIGVESTSKYFTIECPCLKYNAKPTFIYRIKEPAQIINKNAFEKLNIRSLAMLINYAKQTTDLTATELYIYFFIEKNNDNEYVMHKVRLMAPRKQQVIIDYENIQRDTPPAKKFKPI